MKFGSIAVGFLIAVALGGIYVLVVGPGKPVGDDDPIVVAGGSFEIGSLKGFNKDPGGDPNKAIHTEPARYLNRVEVLYNKPAIAGGDEGGPAYAKIVPDSQKSVTIDIDYCPNKCVGTANDVITFNANLSDQNLGVANSDKNLPIGDSEVLVAQLGIEGNHVIRGAHTFVT